MDLESKRSLISIRLQMLIDVFGKRVTDEGLEALRRIYCDALENFPEKVICKGFSRAEQTLERFPTPKTLAGICGEAMPPQTWRYDFRPSEDVDPEFGTPVKVLIDPDPNCAQCRAPKSEHPTSACKEYKTSGLGDDRVMFKPQDCPEGRAFLKKLREIAGRKP
jgi:hypothetical protein